jgi:Kdo2-lipid IVA lauroyltransferase/acyltransferase
MARKSNILNRIIYSLIISYHLLSRIIPIKIWLFMGRCFGLLFYFLDFRHRSIALTNFRFALGNERTEKEIEFLARKNFQEFSMIAHEWVGLININKQKLRNLICVEGKEHVLAAKKKHRSIILLSAHFGNWEYAHLFYGSTINRLNLIVRKIDNPLIEQERVTYNKQFGVNILYKENGLRTAIKNLKKGEDLIILADQKASLKEGIPCNFFGKKTSTLTVVPALAKKYQIPIIPMFITRCKDRVHHRIVFLPELDISNVSNNDNIHEITQRQNHIIEKVIKMYPDHWLWFHRKWKCYHPHIYKS